MFNRLIYCIIHMACLTLTAQGIYALPSGSESLFASGKWIKIETPATGIHKIYYSWLKKNGFLYPEKVRIFGSRNEMMTLQGSNSIGNRPVQIPFLRNTDGNGNTSLQFYVQGPVTWKFNAESGQFSPLQNQSAHGKSFFYLTEDAGTDLLVTESSQPAENPDVSVTSYDDFVLWGEENLNLLESGSRWFSSVIAGNSVLSRNFSFSSRLDNERMNLKLFAAGRSSKISGLEVSINGNILGNLSFSPVSSASDSDYARLDSLETGKIITGNDISVTMRYNGSLSDQCWFDYAALQYRSSLKYNGVPLVFRDSKSLGESKILEYRVNGSKSGLILLDITDPLAPKEIVYRLVNGQIIFKSANEKLKNFLLYDPAADYPSVTISEVVNNVDLSGITVPEFLIITPTFLLDQANRLAAFHRQADGLIVEVVTIESIFNEFSGGYPDIYALRNFIRSLYEKKGGTNSAILKYLLLFGKGTCDPVHDSNDNNPNWIPAFQSENSLSNINSYVTDDFYGQLGSESPNLMTAPDIGIGRIPAVSVEEASVVVDKIIQYHEARSLGEWRNNLTFIGDDEDNNIHVNDSETLGKSINQKNPEYRTGKIYLDAYPQVLNPEERYPAVNEAILRSVRSGNLIVNYIGHASEDGLAHERVLTISDIDAMTNKDKLSLFVTATCEFSRWDMVMKRSAGEHLLFNPAGGAIALLSATRLVYAASNFEINKSFFSHAFEKDATGLPWRLGDLIRMTKNENSGSINTLKFCLLGDPALRLNYPEYRCKDLEINHMPVSQFQGTLSPMNTVTISGEIQDATGKKLESYNGNLSVSVYDQPTGVKTLGNNGLAPFNYQVQDNILFKGTVPVRNGLYTYSFVIPKDVSFNPGAGLIRYYFSDGRTDGNGTFSPIGFNGIEITSTPDKKGPDIQLYLENDKFRDGNSVSQKPLLLAHLSDESGINTSGIGIGHDILVELDGNAVHALIINDYYIADAGSWTSGSIAYPFVYLSEGEHILKLKAWDNANNSSTATIHFNVENRLKMDEVLIFPNPFSDRTEFVITQNRYDDIFVVTLEIMDMQGRKISSSSQILGSGGYVIHGLTWEPGQLNVAPAGGVYIYRITLTAPDGNSSSKSGRLVWKK